jgi:hypothetical protein
MPSESFTAIVTPPEIMIFYVAEDNFQSKKYSKLRTILFAAAAPGHHNFALSVNIDTGKPLVHCYPIREKSNHYNSSNTQHHTGFHANGFACTTRFR